MTHGPTGAPTRVGRVARPRTTVRRLPDKQVHGRPALDALLDSALVAHVAVLENVDLTQSPIQPPQPFVVPLAFARDGDRLLVHGSTASRAFRSLATGAPTCVTVTVVDGVIVARSQFESSMRYRSAMILGSFTTLRGQRKRDGLDVVVARLLPGLTGARPPSPQELRATSVLSLPILEWSMKVSDGHPDDAAGDVRRRVWAGVVPLNHSWGTPISAPDLVAGVPAPTALRSWPRGQA